MTEKEAIEALKLQGGLTIEGKAVRVQQFFQGLVVAEKALEKQIPIKPKIETTKEVPFTHRLGRLLYFYCPTCGKFLLGIYETDPQRGGGISKDMKGCPKCLQALDFTEWYHQEDDNLVFED